MGLAALDCSFCSMDLLLLMLNHRLHLHNRSGFELLYYINALGVPMSANQGATETTATAARCTKSKNAVEATVCLQQCLTRHYAVCRTY